MHRTTMLLALLFAVAIEPARAQVVRGVVLEGGSGSPLEGAMVVLLELDGRVADRVLSDETGAFIADAAQPGPHRIRVDRIGYESLTTERFDVPVGGTFQRVTVPIRAVELEGLQVEGARRCELRGEQGGATARVWEEARKALEAAAWTQSSGAYRYTLLQFERDLDREGRRVIDERRRFTRGTGQATYVSVPVAELVEHGFVQVGRDGSVTYHAPDAEAFLSDEFLDTHCMGLQEAQNGLLGLAFEPVKGRNLPEIRGTLWIEAATARLQRLDFAYVNRPFQSDVGEAGGHVTFGRLPNGAWVVRDWSVRMPMIATDHQRTRLFLNGYREQGGTVWRVVDHDGSVLLEASTATVTGTVVDSLGEKPVEGATVRIAGGPEGEMTTVTSAAGTFAISGVPAGGQLIEVGHPSLDTLGLGSVPLQVDTRAGEITSTRLRLPAPGEILRGACSGTASPARPTAVVFGRVVQGGRPAADARVRIRWLAPGRDQLSVQTHAAPAREGIEPPSWSLDLDDTRWLVTQLDERGVFMLCGVPRGTQVQIEAGREGGSTTVRTVTITPADEIVVVSVPIQGGGS